MSYEHECGLLITLPIVDGSRHHQVLGMAIVRVNRSSSLSQSREMFLENMRTFNHQMYEAIQMNDGLSDFYCVIKGKSTLVAAALLGSKGATAPLG